MLISLSMYDFDFFFRFVFIYSCRNIDWSTGEKRKRERGIYILSSTNGSLRVAWKNEWCIKSAFHRNEQTHCFIWHPSVEREPIRQWKEREIGWMYLFCRLFFLHAARRELKRRSNKTKMISSFASDRMRLTNNKTFYFSRQLCKSLLGLDDSRRRKKESKQ